MTGQIHFLLNEREVYTSAASGVTVLDYLRQVERLTGTKENCSEGGCGACTVLVGELDMSVKYEWIEKEAYSTWNNLVEYVEKVLKYFVPKYTINFA